MPPSSPIKNAAVLVVGANGALGRAVITTLSKSFIPSIGIDFTPNNEASTSLLLPPSTSTIPASVSASSLFAELGKLEAKGGKKIGAVIYVTGGCQGGSLVDPGFMDSLEAMYKMNTQSAALATHLAARIFETSQLSFPNGLVVLTRAHAALSPTPGMVGYGISKTSTHYLVKTLAASNSSRLGATIGILPVTIDTPSNRAAMPEADFSYGKRYDLNKRDNKRRNK